MGINMSPVVVLEPLQGEIAAGLQFDLSKTAAVCTSSKTYCFSTI